MTVKGYIDKIIHLQKMRDYSSAFTILQEALSFYPANSFLLTSEIFLLMKLGNIPMARQKAEQGISQLKDNPFFLKTYISILIKEKDREGIRNITERIKSLSVKDEELYIFLADALSKIGEKQTAIELLRTTLMDMPLSEKLKKHLSTLTDEPAYESGVSYYRERFKDVSPEDAIAEIENILILPDYKDDISIRLFLAELYKKRGDLKKAENVYLEVLKIKDSPFARKMLGYVYYKMREFDKAFLYLKDPFIQRPDDHALFSTMSKILDKIDNIHDVEAMLNEALTKNPKAGAIYGLRKKINRRVNKA